MGKQHLIVSGVLEGSEGNVLVLKEEENVSDRDPNYQTTIDQDEFEMLQNLSLSHTEIPKMSVYVIEMLLRRR